MPTELYLIRHGESVANVEPIIGGRHGDVGLTARGRRQAELLEERLREHPIEADVLYTSTLPRAQETGTYVARALGLTPRVDDDLRELDPGEADGLSVAEWRDRYPGLDRGPQSNPYHRFAPGGESWASFLTRAGAALHAVLARHRDQTVVVVTHGGVIECSVLLGFGLGPTADHFGFDLANTGITHWRHRAGRSDGRPEWTLVGLNDAQHLAGEIDGDPPRPSMPTTMEE